MKFWGRYFLYIDLHPSFFMFSKTRSVNPLNSFQSFLIPIESTKAWITEWLSTLRFHLMHCPKGKKDSENRGPTNGVLFNRLIKKIALKERKSSNSHKYSFITAAVLSKAWTDAAANGSGIVAWFVNGTPHRPLPWQVGDHDHHGRRHSGGQSGLGAAVEEDQFMLSAVVCPFRGIEVLGQSLDLFLSTSHRSHGLSKRSLSFLNI